MTSIDKKDIELLHKFLTGGLAGVELAKVEERLNMDKSFRDQYQILAKEHLLFKEQAKKVLKEEARVLLSATEEPKQQRRSIFKIKTIGIAATLLMLLGSSFWFWQFQNRTGGQERIYATYFELPQPSYTRSPNVVSDSLYIMAMNAYEGQDFEKAVRDFDNIESKDSLTEGKEKMTLFYSLSLSQIGRESDAISTLREISENSSFYLEAQWYMALLSAKIGNYDEARTIFTMLENQNQFKSRESGEILKVLID